MEIVLYDQARKDIIYWKKSGQKNIMKKITNLLKAIQQKPYSGIGKPEELKHKLSGWWSRRIDKEHRLIYKVLGNEIHVLSLRFHYT